MNSNINNNYILINDCKKKSGIVTTIPFNSETSFSYYSTISSTFYDYINNDNSILKSSISSTFYDYNITNAIFYNYNITNDNSILHSEDISNYSKNTNLDSVNSNDLNIPNKTFISSNITNNSFSPYSSIDSEINIISSNKIENAIIKNKTNIKKEKLKDFIPKIMDSIEIGKNYEITGEDFNLIIKPTNASFLENTTHVDFIQCENILRDKYHIAPSRIITFLQLELDENNEQSLVNKVEYQAYDDKKNILNLDICNNSNIKIFYAIKIIL